jgi:hypothetical protein
MPVELSKWVLGRLDPIKIELAILGRRSISVNVDSYARVFGIKNEDSHVFNEMETEAIKFMNEEYGRERGTIPEFADWSTKIKNVNGAANMKFLQAYIAGVISCFVSPSTSSSISPSGYRSIYDLKLFRRTNFVQFAIDQIINEVKKMGVKKKFFLLSLHHLVVKVLLTDFIFHFYLQIKILHAT